MGNELQAFSDTDGVQHTGGAHVELDVLVIEQGSVVLAILSSAVDSVIPWQTPEPLPLCAQDVLGVVQDRGRLVIVQRFAAGADRPSRLIVCTTTGGLIGVAATATRLVGTIEIQGELQVDVPLQTSSGPLTIIDPERIARRMMQVGGA